MRKKCLICGTDFKIKPSQYAKRKTCSRQCQGVMYKTTMIGVNNPAYKRTYCTKLTHPEWASQISRTCKGRINLGDKNGMKNPVARAKVSATRKIMMQNPDVRKKISESSRSAWANGKFDGVRVGQCKWYEYKKRDGITVKVQGRWELAFVEWADKNDLDLVCHRGRIPYIDSNGVQRFYYPDFYIEQWGALVDVKNNYHYQMQKDKFDCIRRCNPDLHLIILTEEKLRELGVILC